MEKHSLKTYRKTMKDEETQVVYDLIFRNALYSLECYKDGYHELMHYSFLDNLTEDEGEAEAFQLLITKGKVSPIHIKEIAEDYFGL